MWRRPAGDSQEELLREDGMDSALCLSVMLWFFALRASLNWGPPCDSLSMCLPCVQDISQDRRCFLGDTEV